MKIILASASPRRQELLKGLGINFEICVKSIDERFDASLSPTEIASYLANEKMQPFLPIAPDTLTITADTLVFIDGIALGKPDDLAHAAAMLQTLSGRAHTVVTGVCMATAATQETFCVASTVYFRAITQAEIAHYLKNHAPLDRAGSYGIQDWIGYAFIEKIEGCYYNVMGLPTSELYARLKKYINFI